VKALKNHGITCTINETEGLYKVYCGEFRHESNAYTLKRKISSLGHEGVFVVSLAAEPFKIIKADRAKKQALFREATPPTKEESVKKFRVPSQEEVTTTTGTEDVVKAKEKIKKPSERVTTEGTIVAQEKKTNLADKDLSYGEEREWSIQLEPMWMDVEGNDLHVGDVFKYREELDGSTLTYGITYEPIKLNMKDKITLRAEIIYRKDQWGLGVSGWWFNIDASQGGSITTPPEVITPTGYIYYESGVRMWDNTILPVLNDLEDSGLSPVTYWAKNELGVWTVDLYGIRTLAEKKDSLINLTFGLKLGSLDSEREEGQKQRAFVYDFYGGGFHLDNHITLESASEADYSLMAGPAIGLQGKAKYKSFGIEGLIDQSLLIGRVKQSGTWTDIEDIWVVTGPVGGPFTPVSQDAYLEGKFSFSKGETIALPVTEAKLKVLFVRERNASLGIGGFASIWWNAPVAPKWSIPGAWVWDEGTGWRLQEDTLIFYGLMVAYKIRF